MRQKKEKNSKIRQKINQIYEENELANLESNRNRARSFTVGTAFGGVIEVSMRGDYNNLWCLLQPVEAVEFIEQLAAAAGLQVALRPKQDFSTWRGWDIETDNKHWVGAARWQINLNDSPDTFLGTGAEPHLLEASEENYEDDLIETEKKKPIKRKKTTKVSKKPQENFDDLE